MCIVKVVKKPYKNESSIFNLINYALTDKRSNTAVRYYGGYNVGVLRAAEQFVLVNQYFQKWDDRKMRHFVVSFDENIAPYDAYILGWQIAAFYADRYQIVFGVHDNTENVHIHFVFNTVSFVDGLKYSESYSDLYKLNVYVDKTYNEYMEHVQH